MRQDTIGRKKKMPFVVSFLNCKGGSGKTTLATHVATKLQIDKEKILLVDTDTQQSAIDWYVLEQREFQVKKIDNKDELKKGFRVGYSNYDWIIIDGVPNIEGMALETINCSDLVIIPLQPSGLDTRATSTSVDLIKAKWDLEGSKKPLAYFCITRKIVNSNLAKDIYEALGESQILTMKSSTASRVDYITSISQGKTVFETNNIKAKKEITDIVNEIKQILA